jgi:hypothetical protein
VTDYLESASPRRPFLSTIAAVTTVLVALVLVYAIREHYQDQSRARDASSLLAADPTPVPAALAGGELDGEPLKLVPGGQRISGVQVGFPHTRAGAVSAAVEYWSQVASTLDPDRAATLGRLITDDSWTAAAAVFASGATDARRALSLPTTGDTVEGASITVESEAYQLRDVSADRITVLLLGYVTTVSPSEGDRTQIEVHSADMHWSGQDWKIERAPDTDYSELTEQPGTAAAVAAGWLGFER